MAEFLDYFRMERLPHIWCPGCGHGTVTGALVRAIDKLGLDTNNWVRFWTNLGAGDVLTHAQVGVTNGTPVPIGVPHA